MIAPFSLAAQSEGQIALTAGRRWNKPHRSIQWRIVGRRPAEDEKEHPSMKQEIHPEYHQVQVSCACGNIIEIRSTRKNLSLDICNQCHPFFTGKQKLIDTAGRIERFHRKYGKKGDKDSKAKKS